MTEPKKKGRAADRHEKGSKQMRVRAIFVGPLEQLANRKGSKPAEQMNRAVLELLEREGLWPPKEKS